MTFILISHSENSLPLVLCMNLNDNYPLKTAQEFTLSKVDIYIFTMPRLQ